MPGQRAVRGVVRSGLQHPLWAEEMRAGLARVAMPGYNDGNVTVLALGKRAFHCLLLLEGGVLGGQPGLEAWCESMRAP